MNSSSDREESPSSEEDDFNKLKPQKQPEQSKPQTPAKQNDIVSLPRQLHLVKEAKPRLIIDHMVLENFKSYADTQTIGKFHKNFTSIVGPNGSGKSNLIESMLFIFGFSASWMRLNKLNQLIHNSSTMGEVSRAAVEVHFKKVINKSDGSVSEIPGSNFFIRRTVNSQSQSKYYLEGTESTQGQVKQKLKSEGIDLKNNRFLILQGQVEQISQMKQKSGDRDKPGLLEYLQQIIGSNQFIEKIQEAVVEFNQIQQKKHEKGQIMKIVENELKGMSKGKQQAIRFVKKQKRMFQLQNILQQVAISSCKQQLSLLEVRLREQQDIKKSIVEEEKQRLKKQGEKIMQIKQNKAQMEDIQKAVIKLNEQLSKMDATDKNITEEVKFNSEDLVNYERKVNQIDKELNKIITESQQIKQKMPSNTERLSHMQERVEKMKHELTKHDKPHLHHQIKQSEAEIKKYDIQISSFSSKLETLRQTFKNTHNSQQDQLKKIKQFEQKKSESTLLHSKIESAQKVAIDVCNSFKSKIYELNRQKDHLKNQLTRIDIQMRENIDQRQESGQNTSMFKQIMKMKVPEIIGRLGDLGSTPKQYQEIITTCCSRLDNIVVTNYEAASAVVNFLKRTQLGRTTCIILDKIQDYRNYMNKNYQTPNDAVRLFDVIKPQSDDAKVAFYFALNDTLYCENSDIGLELSKARRRVISRKRNGYIIYETNGLMIGSAPKQGGFQTKGGMKGRVKGDDLAKELEQKRRDLTGKLEDINRKIQSEEQNLKTSSQDVEQMKKQLQTLIYTIRDAKQQIKDLHQMLLRNEKNKVSPESLKNQITSLEGQISKLTERKGKEEKKLKKFQEEQEKNQNSEIKELRQNYKKQKNQYIKFQKQIDRYKAILETTVKRVDGNKKERKQNEQKINFLKKNIQKLKNDQEELQKKGAEMIGKLTALNKRTQECKQKQQQLRTIVQEEENEVRESKLKVQKAKKDVEVFREAYKNQQNNLKIGQSELERVHQQYKDMTSSYDFMEQLDQIQKMGIVQPDSKQPQDLNASSMLETSLLLNQSSDSLNMSTAGSKAFPMDKLVKIQPLQEISDQKLEPFKIFKDKLSALVVSESMSLKKMELNNLQIINEFRLKFISYKEKFNDFEAVKEKQLQLKRIIDVLKQNRLRLFREGFGIINSKLKQVYQHLTRGGDAELQLIDSLDPFSDGVNFSVRPPKKSWKQVNKLSGGEKTLSSLSLIFALHYFKPTPLYFMDEIDAALDFKNVSIVADYIKKRTKDAQFIIISLRNNMFDLADKLIGVYKTNDKTKVINLEAAKLIAQREQLNQKENQECNANSK